MLTRSPRLMTFSLLLVTATLSGGATSCPRFFGNYSESQPSAGNEIGYYEMAPQRSVLTAVHSNRGTLTQDVNFSSIPYDIVTATLTNPVIFYGNDRANGAGLLVNPTELSLRLPTYWDTASGALNLNATASNPNTSWPLKPCSMISYIQLTGQINAGSGPFYTHSSETLSGRITMHATSDTRFEGDCTAMLSDMQACYGDVTQCAAQNATLNQARQEEVRTLFEKHIQSGLISGSDISRTTSVAYDVYYQ